MHAMPAISLSAIAAQSDALQVYWSPLMSGSPAGACNVPGLTEEEYALTMLQPWGDDAPVYLANNDYIMQDVRYIYGDWAEDSLLQVVSPPAQRTGISHV